MNPSSGRLAALSLVLAALAAALGCSTAPKAENRASFTRSADSALWWFEKNVPGLRRQINGAAAYLVFPDVAQWGILFGGGEFGRGELSRPSGVQIGWGAINMGSVGLQAGVRGFKMLMVIEDEATLNQLRRNQLSGSVSAVGVAGESGGGTTMPFQDGIAIYQGADTGLMAGVNVSLDYIRYKSLAEE